MILMIGEVFAPRHFTWFSYFPVGLELEWKQVETEMLFAETPETHQWQTTVLIFCNASQMILFQLTILYWGNSTNDNNTVKIQT